MVISAHPNEGSCVELTVNEKFDEIAVAGAEKVVVRLRNPSCVTWVIEGSVHCTPKEELVAHPNPIDKRDPSF